MRCFILAIPFLCLGIFRVGAAAEPWPLGTFTLGSPVTTNVPPGFTAYSFTVSNCPRVTQPMNGTFGIAGPTQGSSPRGLVIFFTGGPGSEWWSEQQAGPPELLRAFLEDLRAQGFTIVQVKWSGTWHHSSPGNDAGTAHLGCRPATVIKYIHDRYYLPMGIPRRRGQAGFCITGNSGGASQVGYALSHYGLESILDVVIPTGGPPHSVLEKCMLAASTDPYFYNEGTRARIDKGFGFFNNDGPGFRQDASFTPRWQEESVATGGSDYDHPMTRVHFIQGAQDRGMQTVGGDYYNRLRSEGTWFASWEIAPDTQHETYASASGRAALRAAILGTVVSAPSMADGRFEFSVSGPANYNYTVESSANLSDWTAVQTQQGPFTFRDATAGSAPARFYRVMTRPEPPAGAVVR